MTCFTVDADHKCHDGNLTNAAIDVTSHVRQIDVFILCVADAPIEIDNHRNSRKHKNAVMSALELQEYY